jgi:hypothetical protein
MAIAMFLGAPMLAREYAAGTTWFAWTQGTERARQVLVRLALLGVTVMVAGAGLGQLAQWSLAPAIRNLPVELSPGWHTVVFNATPLAMSGDALLGLAVGVLAGVVVRRVVPAMAVAAAAVTAVFVLSYSLHDRLLSLGARTMRDLPNGVYPNGPVAPDGLISLHQVTARGSSGPPGTWLSQGWYAGPGGHRISGGPVARLMDLSLRQLTARHISFWVSYQPASRYGLLVSVQADVTLVLALLLGALAVWLIQTRRA